MNIYIRQVQEDDSSSFYCDKKYQHLVNFFNKKSYRWQKLCFGRTLVGIEKKSNRIVSFVTISISSIESENIPDIGEKMDCPVLLIGKLLVDEQFQKSGIGKTMVAATVGIAKKLNELSACRFVMVHSHPEAVGFYKRIGFKEITGDKKHVTMVFDLLKSK